MKTFMINVLLLHRTSISNHQVIPKNDEPESNLLRDVVHNYNNVEPYAVHLTNYCDTLTTISSVVL